MWESLPAELYSAEQVRQIDQLALSQLDLENTELMQKAAQAAWQRCQQLWPEAQSYHVFCGAGNNAGDGYWVAALAQAAGKRVRVTALAPLDKLSGAAKQAAEHWLAQGGAVDDFNMAHSPDADDVVVDAITGTGLSRNIEGLWHQAICWVNERHGRAVLSLDVPSGLCASTGRVRGDAIRASATVTFIALKVGLCTGSAADFRGELTLADLGVDLKKLNGVPKPMAKRLLLSDWLHWLAPRQATSHKGLNGHMILLGGFQGMSGAVLLAAEAALRTGTGLVSVGTWPGHANQLNLGRPEIMVRGVLDKDELEDLAPRANVAAIGPGLGRTEWSKQLFRAAAAFDIPQVIDADGLHALAEYPDFDNHRVLTPHPGEAGKLLGISSIDVQRDRVAAVLEIQKRYGGVVLLKGSGTLIATPRNELWVCTDGNPGMGVGGMGDVLTGIVASLIGQGLPLRDATCLGALLHSQAGDRVAEEHGERGMLPSDLMPVLRAMVNENQTGRRI